MQVDNVASGHALGLKDLGIQASAVSGIAPTYLGAKGPCTTLNDYRAKAGR
jgi:NADH dehydrogenase